MSQFMILFYENEAAYAKASPEVWQQIGASHARFAQQVAELGGKIMGGNALQPSATATSIRGGTVASGPFVKTKEALCGFYLIEAKDLAQACAIAKVCPAPHGGVEVRPILEMKSQ